MRIDIYLKKLGFLESRNRWKDLKVFVNEHEKKPSYEVKPGDKVQLIYPNGSYIIFEVKAIPEGNVPQKDRTIYYSMIDKGEEKRFKSEKESFIRWLFENY